MVHPSINQSISFCLSRLGHRGSKLSEVFQMSLFQLLPNDPKSFSMPDEIFHPSLPSWTCLGKLQKQEGCRGHPTWMPEPSYPGPFSLTEQRLLRSCQRISTLMTLSARPDIARRNMKEHLISGLFLEKNTASIVKLVNKDPPLWSSLMEASGLDALQVKAGA